MLNVFATRRTVAHGKMQSHLIIYVYTAADDDNLTLNLKPGLDAGFHSSPAGAKADCLNLFKEEKTRCISFVSKIFLFYAAHLLLDYQYTLYSPRFVDT